MTKIYAIIYGKFDQEITRVRAKNRKEAFKIFTDRYGVIEVQE